MAAHESAHLDSLKEHLHSLALCRREGRDCSAYLAVERCTPDPLIPSLADATARHANLLEVGGLLLENPHPTHQDKVGALLVPRARATEDCGGDVNLGQPRYKRAKGIPCLSL